MNMAIGNRQSVYFSDVRDFDLKEYLSPLITHRNFSQVAKDLMRDGIKFRESSSRPQVIQSNTSLNQSSLQNVELKKKEVSNEDIEDRLDNF